MKLKILLIISLLCLLTISCKGKSNRMEVTVEQFDEHPTWTDSNPEAFWE